MTRLNGGSAGTVTGLPSVKVNPNITSYEVDGELVLVHLESNKIFRLSSSAGRFWELLSEAAKDSPSVRVVTVFQQMLEEYDVAENVLLANITALVGELTKYEFVSSAGSA